jgi:hypothetical protein
MCIKSDHCQITRMPFTPSLPTDPHWLTKLRKVKHRASQGPGGYQHFLQLRSNPLSCVYIVSGDIIPDGDGVTREISMRFVGPPEYFPVIPDGKKAIQERGFRKHLTRHVERFQEDRTVPCQAMTKNEWIRLFDEVTTIVDNAIYENHGIKCFEDGNIRNDSPANTYYLHVCDIFNMMHTKSIGIRFPMVVIITTMLESIYVDTTDELSSVLLNEEQKNFLLEEIDFFYIVYGYYGNGSMLPIRTTIPEDCSTFVESSFFMNDGHFLNHQFGKFEELDWSEESIISKIMFRVL